MNASALRILAGLLAGLGIGAALGAVRSPALPVLAAVADPIGRLWVDALTMTVVPLVFALLVSGMAAASREAESSRAAMRALAWFAALLVTASALSGLAAGGLLALWPPAADAAALQAPPGPAPRVSSAADWLAGLVPANPIKAAAEGAVVQLVVFATLFGLALGKVPQAPRQALLEVIDGLGKVMLTIVGWVLWAAPLGVLALAFGVGARLGGGAVGVLLHYVVLVCAMCLMTTALAYAVAILAGGMPPLAFAQAAAPSQLVALSTRSSLASLPAMVKAAPGLGVPETSAGVILPLAVAVFRAASAAANIAVALYLAHLHGVAVAPWTLLTAALVTAAVSVAAVGLPAQVSFVATIGPVCLALGVPLSLLPLLLAVESIPDLFRTLGNVTADLAVTRAAGRADKEKGAPA